MSDASASQGSLLRTVGMSFVYGIATVGVLYQRIFGDNTYVQDHLSMLVIAPLGSFIGFVLGSIIHELGHYAATRLLRGHVLGILIGSGQRLGGFRFLGVSWEIHASLRSGAVIYFLCDTVKARLRLTLITAAGPLASLLLAVVLFTAVFEAHSNAPQPGNGLYYVIPFVASLTLANLSLLVSVLIPRRYIYAGRPMESDVLRLFTIPRISDERLAVMATAGIAARDKRILAAD